MKIVYLEPRASFRNNLRSDTLWGLICWGIKTVYSEEKLEEFIAGYKTGKILKISSLFFYKGVDKEERKLFFPRPILEPLNLNRFFKENNIESKKERAKYISKIKQFKKIEMIDQDTLAKFLTGELTEESFFMKEELWKNTPELKREDVLHNTIDRIKNTTVEGALFTTSEQYIKNGGLFFLIDGSEELLKIVEGALRFFNHIGFGGDASIGKNSFQVEIEDFNFPVPENPNAFVTLSLYSPLEEELSYYKGKSESLWYDLETRKGKFGGQFIKTSRFWKDSVLMFKEGSVFPLLNKESYGQNKVVLSKDENGYFDVYHFGYAFDLPLRLN
jgi:CRISPR-associated protein Csm4